MQQMHDRQIALQLKLQMKATPIQMDMLLSLNLEWLQHRSGGGSSVPRSLVLSLLSPATGLMVVLAATV
jgi:hypothetical protein